MKDKTADSEGHRIKVGLEQHKSLSSNSTTPQTCSPNPSGSGTKSLTAGQKGAPAQNSGGHTSKDNFDDDYNEWDISIGDLIIDLDADIERQSEGDTKNSSGSSDKTENNEIVTPSQNNQTIGSGMSSNLKSNRFSGGTVARPINNSVVAGNLSTSPKSLNSTPNNSHAHHGPVQRTAFPTTNSTSPSVNSKIEHLATVDKGLKMKIKRKSIGGRSSETKHEIVSSEISTKAFAGPLDHANNTNSPSKSGILAPIPAIGENSIALPISVINKNKDREDVTSPVDTDAQSKSSKHLNKNKFGHKKDKTKQEKDKQTQHVKTKNDNANDMGKLGVNL